MFTQATREFGVWKSTHPSHGRHTGSPTTALVVAFGMCAFVCWLVFFLALKIRGQFFVLENNGLRLMQVSRNSGALFEGRQAALRFGVRDAGHDGVELLFESGEILRHPEQEGEIRSLALRRVREMELTGMLTLVASPAIGRLQIWPEQGISPAKMSGLLRFLASLGFEDFDIAMEVE